jgi:hypothetical protein
VMGQCIDRFGVRRVNRRNDDYRRLGRQTSCVVRVLSCYQLN